MSYFYPPTIDLTDDIAAMTNREQQEAEDVLVREDCDDRDGIPQLLQNYDDEREAALEDEAHDLNLRYDVFAFAHSVAGPPIAAAVDKLLADRNAA